MQATKADKAEAISTLKNLCPPGTTIYTVLRHVSRSGMQRALDVYVMEDNAPRRITWPVCKAVGYGYSDKYDALTIGGCGMDMGYDVVHNLSWVLHRDGFECTGERCPSNDHSNGIVEDGKRKPFPRGAGVRHEGHGYSLNHRWM
jgi:hypothetical protein